MAEKIVMLLWCGINIKLVFISSYIMYVLFNLSVYLTFLHFSWHLMTFTGLQICFKSIFFTDLLLFVYGDFIYIFAYM